MTSALVVGFDLDMTLVDSRPGIAAVHDRLSEETGVYIDSALAVTRLGPPLDVEYAEWFPPEQVDAAIDRYRELYPDLAIAPTVPLPGAREAIAAVRELGGRVVVVTGKHEPNAALHLEHLGLDADVLVGNLHGSGKAAALRKHGVDVYVGDHVGDVVGAHLAGAVAVTVSTGPYTQAQLADAGAEVSLPDLTGFAPWLRETAGASLDDLILERRCRLLTERLQQLPGVVVAFSGGADSAFLLAAAVRALGPDRVLAATAVSPSLATTERSDAAAFAKELGVEHVQPVTDELSREGYRANAGDRCYFCKSELLDVVGPIGAERGWPVATGTNADDARAGFRPGIRAAAERGAVTPLLDARLTKGQVRELSRQWGLRTWDKPAAACLSSRVAYGISITPQRLARVERAEAALRTALAAAGLQVRDLRVRDLGERARVELDTALLARVSQEPDVLEQVTAALREVGFDDAEVDPRGFRSGSMNELLPDAERYR
ncbi:MAG: ATP-dependent sacrificial sulfur transferase LarE [Actinomycetales bacterium]